MSTKNQKAVPKLDAKFIQISKPTENDEPALLSLYWLGDWIFD